MTDFVYANGDTVTYSDGTIATAGHSSTAHVDTNDRVFIPPIKTLSAGVKPTGPQEIDWAHPLAQGLLMFAFPVAGGLIDLVTGRMFVPQGTTDPAIEPRNDKGLCAGFQKAQEHGFYLEDALPELSGYNHIVESLWQLDSHDTSGSMLFGWNDNETRYWQIGSNVTAFIAAISTNLIIDPDDGDWHHSFGVSSEYGISGNGRRWYVDGTWQSTGGTAIGLNSGSKGIYIGKWPGGSSWDWDGPIAFVRVWDSIGKTEEDFDSLTKDPYQFLKSPVPETQIITTPPTANDRVWVV